MDFPSFDDIFRIQFRACIHFECCLPYSFLNTYLMFYKIADDTLVASLSIIGSPIIMFCLFPFVLKLQCREFGDI